VREREKERERKREGESRVERERERERERKVKALMIPIFNNARGRLSKKVKNAKQPDFDALSDAVRA
jgi:hypothetical protein